MTTLNDVLHHALTDIKRTRRPAEQTRMAAHLDALTAHIQAVVADLDDNPYLMKRVIIEDRTTKAPRTEQPRHRKPRRTSPPCSL